MFFLKGSVSLGILLIITSKLGIIKKLSKLLFYKLLRIISLEFIYNINYLKYIN